MANCTGRSRDPKSKGPLATSGGKSEIQVSRWKKRPMGPVLCVFVVTKNPCLLLNAIKLEINYGKLIGFFGFVGRHKGKRIVRWFKLHLSKDSSKDFNHYAPNYDVRFWLPTWLTGKLLNKVAKCVNQCAELIRQRTCNATISALEVISEVLPISSYSEKLLEMKGEALLMLGRYEEVIQLYEQTLVFAEKNVATTADDNYSEVTTNPTATTTTIGENLLGDAIIQPRRVG
ncbi:hypothetical protein Vadar_005576 [Vaccinium darrowii]|uniref:Uncharacterized protein n=1 Tax=Vaccinium darrowii TaxID=229202 RepID=A0ACB7XFN3_9ERIC|nr:hypothetical protein Vadar_005576 [Vaccinium darrowii]